MRVPYVNLPAQHAPLRERILEAVGRVLDHGQFILGPEVAELESRLAAVLRAGHVVAVSSGTDALCLALRLRGIGPGDEVITVSHSFVATASAIVLCGATPVFVDIDEDSMLMDPALVERAVTARTRAVIAVHLNGFPCDMDHIGEICARRRLALIEDCAQAFGALHRGRSVGTFGVGCFSLHPLKPLSACGDAGFVTVERQADADRLRELRNLGLRDRDHCAAVSGNNRLDTLQAAILLVKLDCVGEWLEARRSHAMAYREQLPRQLMPPPGEGANRASYSAFVVRHRRRDRLAALLADRGIDARVHYPLAIHQQQPFAAQARPLPVTERVVSQILSLPVTPELGVKQREHVIRAMRDALGELEDTDEAEALAARTAPEHP